MKTVLQQVDQLVRKFGTRCPFELCGHLQITILYSDLPDHVEGFFLNLQQHYFIYLNEQLSDQQRHVILAHELGHAVLHPSDNTLYLRNSTYLLTSRYERQADVFASHLLLEDVFFEEMLQQGNTLKQISQLSGVPLSYVRLKGESCYQHKNNFSSFSPFTDAIQDS